MYKSIMISLSRAAARIISETPNFGWYKHFRFVIPYMFNSDQEEL